MVADRDAREWWEHWNAMSDEELLDERFRLYDFAEDLEPGCGMHQFASTAAALILGIERQRAARLQLSGLAAVTMPDVDPDRFADALIALNGAHRELYGEVDAGEVWRAAIGIAESTKQEDE